MEIEMQRLVYTKAVSAIVPCSSPRDGSHALVIPHPLQGHITPLFHLSEKLAAKGIIVTFVTTQYNHLKIMKACSGHQIVFDPAFHIQDMIDYIPGLPPLEPKDLPSHIQDGDSASYMNQTLSTQFELVSRADWVIGNTVDDLESDALIQVKTPICSVGPLLHSACFDELNSCEKNTPTKTSLRAESNCLPSLDSKPRSCVVYVSLVKMSQTQVQEIAMGLLESQQLFVWVSVLSHPAIGGFFTHGGWNSTLESLSLGVPMLIFPQWYDQYTNRMLIVKQWKVGIELEDHRNEGINIDRGEISRATKALIIGEEGKTLRKNSHELREKIKGATSEGGSSVKNLESFVDFLARKKLACRDLNCKAR
eukprot:Gb_16816 [translate_table: standard]